jgi:hypothetical protein
VTGSVPASDGHPYSNATDGDTFYTPFGIASEFGLQNVVVDLGAVYEIDTIKIWHYWADGRTYHETKTEISENGTDWTTVFDSSVEGEYAETSEGHAITLPVAQNGFEDVHSVESLNVTAFDDRHAVSSLNVTTFEDKHTVAAMSASVFDDVHKIHMGRAASFSDRHYVANSNRFSFYDIHSTEAEAHNAKIITRTNS